MSRLTRREVFGLPLLLAGMQARPAQAQPDPARMAITLANGQSAELEILVRRPSGNQPRPLVLINHGNPTRSVEAYRRPTDVFAQHDLAAVTVMRQGFGASSGGFRESSGTCENRNFVRPGQFATEDILGALRTLQGQPWVDARRVLLVGQSTGGISVLAAAAQNPPGVIGVINFAGGRGGDPNRAQFCQPERLVEAAGSYGRTARVPALWIYTQNDQWFRPDLARAMLNAYRSGGAPAEFIEALPFDTDGHRLFVRAPEIWWPMITPFLRRLGLA